MEPFFPHSNDRGIRLSTTFQYQMRSHFLQFNLCVKRFVPWS